VKNHKLRFLPALP